MPSTVNTTRPDEATGFRHIGDPANALVERINAGQHPNVVKMHDRIDAWVREANARGGKAGLEYLALASARIEQNRQNLSDWAADMAELAQGMDGLTVWDIDAADDRIGRAAQAIRNGAPIDPELTREATREGVAA